GAVVFSVPQAVSAAAKGRDVILVRPFTQAADVAGFHAAKGILTSEGGKASHAALVARGMGVPAVTGAQVTTDIEAQQLRTDGEGRREALGELLPLQQRDFTGIFEAMQGLPVTIRLLDPPLHEFLPDLPELRAQVERARLEQHDDLEQEEQLLARVEEIHEGNPMLGTRGCRLGVLYPEIYEMQVHAIMRAAKAVEQPPHPEIMI